MISVNQGIGTSVPKRVEKRGTDDVTYQGGSFEWGRGGSRNIERRLTPWRITRYANSLYCLGEIIFI